MNSTPQYVVVRYQGTPGLLAAIFACIFGLLSIFSWGLIFVPLAAICLVVAVICLAIEFHLATFGTALIALFLTGTGTLLSPSLLIVMGSLLASLTLTNHPAGTVYVSQPVQQQSNQMKSLPTQNANVSFSARDEANAASLECKNKRLSGELKTFVASAECSNPRILIAYQKGGYRYMDLIHLFTAKRRELAEQTDKGLITEAQDNFKINQFMSWITDEERRRDNRQR